MEEGTKCWGEISFILEGTPPLSAGKERLSKLRKVRPGTITKVKFRKPIKSDFLRASRIERHSRKIDFFFSFHIPLGDLNKGKIV